MSGGSIEVLVLFLQATNCSFRVSIWLSEKHRQRYRVWNWWSGSGLGARSRAIQPASPRKKRESGVRSHLFLGHNYVKRSKPSHAKGKGVNGGICVTRWWRYTTDEQQGWWMSGIGWWMTNHTSLQAATEKQEAKEKEPTTTANQRISYLWKRFWNWIEGEPTISFVVHAKLSFLTTEKKKKR